MYIYIVDIIFSFFIQNEVKKRFSVHPAIFVAIQINPTFSVFHLPLARVPLFRTAPERDAVAVRQMSSPSAPQGEGPKKKSQLLDVTVARYRGRSV